MCWFTEFLRCRGVGLGMGQELQRGTGLLNDTDGNY
jgi:hypothetical protein